MRLVSPFLALIITLLLFPLPAAAQGAVFGRVLEEAGAGPVAGAIVTSGGETVVTGEDGAFTLKVPGHRIAVRAPGYLREERDTVAEPVVHLRRFTPRALYLSVYGIGNRGLREAALRLVETTELNALVIDIKGDWGMVSHRSAVPLAQAVGARKTTTIRDLPGLVADLKGRGIYTIARIVVFKDNPLATARPDLAVRSVSGGIWRDRERLAWTDPFRREVWGYNLAIAEEAARAGFDEIQFDYVRFPDARGVRFSRPDTETNRVGAITGFLLAARERLAPYNVFVAADIFGYVCWNQNDTKIGQRLEDLAPLVDYICPMLYPSGFQYGIPGYANPVRHPYEIVSLSLRRAMKRTGLPPVRFRPWLQAFRDYAFDRRRFGEWEIRAQIRAAEELGVNGWMLWNPRNVYTGAGVRR